MWMANTPPHPCRRLFQCRSLPPICCRSSPCATKWTRTPSSGNSAHGFAPSSPPPGREQVNQVFHQHTFPEKLLAIHSTAMYNIHMKLNKDLVAASSAPLVLSILEEGESYGYAIIGRVRNLS